MILHLDQSSATSSENWNPEHIPYVEHLVRREYSSPMSEKDRYGFCIAATVLAVAGFLAVEAGAVRFPLELIDNLIDPFILFNMPLDCCCC